MSDCLISRRGGGVPPSITYPIVAVLTESGTWTVPESGTYRISCIGSGGVGAIQTGGRYYTCGAGGGAGGIAESSIKLVKSIQIHISVDSGVTSFGNYLSATSGSNASITYSSPASLISAGVGGQANGGNLGNYTGGTGTMKAPVTTSSRVSYAVRGGNTNTAARFGGAQGGDVLGYSNGGNSDTDSAVLTFPHIPLVSGLAPYGAGQGKIYVEITSNTSDCYGSNYLLQFIGITKPIITSVPNGAVIIEQIK